MNAITPNLFGAVLSEIAAGPKVTGHVQLTGQIMRRLAEKGLTLEQCADRRIMKRSISTLQGYAREFGIAFPDYTPSNMRKHVQFVQRGDYLNLVGSEAKAVAAILDAGLDGEGMCAVPVYSFDDAKETLKRARYVAKIAKPSKKAKAVKHG